MDWPPRPGSILRLKDGRSGIVPEPCHWDDTSVEIFVDNAVVSVRRADVVDPPKRRIAERDDLIRHLLAVKFQRAISDNLYSLSASRA